NTFGDMGKVLFVVRNPNSAASRILYKLPIATYQAYNYGQKFNSGGTLVGGNLFADLKSYFIGRSFAGYRVSMRRPGGGTGGDYADGGWASSTQGDPYDLNNRRNIFAHWDAPMIAWLESNGYAPDYCTDWDIHRAGNSLLDAHRYKILVSAGHDEYWSDTVRGAESAFMLAGGNIAVFGGNALEWRITYADGDTSFYCNKN